MRDNPAMVISFSDAARTNRYAEVRGTVVERERVDTLAWVNQLVRTYAGAVVLPGSDGEHRYKVTVPVDARTGEN